jgi:hypothetical protein
MIVVFCFAELAAHGLTNAQGRNVARDICYLKKANQT